MTTETMTAKLIEPELSYKIIGILFKVHTELGNRFAEKYYQRAVEVELKKQGLSYQKEIAVEMEYSGQKIGKYILDFLIENKIVLELKAIGQIRKEDIRQILAYLRASNLKLGIIADFRSPSLTYKRVLNSY